MNKTAITIRNFFIHGWKSFMLFRALYLFLLSGLQTANAQAPFWMEFFDLPCTGNCEAHGYTGINGTWNVTPLAGNTGNAVNIWYISCLAAGMQAGNCSQICPVVPPPPPVTIGQSLHISTHPSILGDIGEVYYIGDSVGNFDAHTDLRVESPVINCTGHTGINLSFTYEENGDGQTDNGELWYFDGANWNLLADLPKTLCCGGVPCNGTNSGEWQAYSIALPVSADNNPNIKIGFRWLNNNDAIGTDPGFAIFMITLQESVTVTSSTKNEMLHLHPNPVTEFLHLEIEPVPAPVKLEIYDISGNRVHEENLPANHSHITIDLRDLKAGLYSLRYRITDEVKVQKLVMMK